ncbi:MAG: hypothetical protein OJF60_000532 [Burkholderiaceae bacterium]|jgi:S1-C subfamily serine protease|nr:MAG: hypothetical protein OJF60_000532 [Burkholderiaceae bacterium]
MSGESSTSPGGGASAAPSISTLSALSDALADAVERMAASVLALPGRVRGTVATATVWRPGIAVTAAHVLRRGPSALTLIGPGGGAVEATAIGIDFATDLAAFRLPDSTLPAVYSVDAAGVRAGHLALLVGRSAQGEASASFGVVNHSAGEWHSWLGGRLDRLIRLDGGVHTGLSGGPVADAAGRVFGIASAALSRHYGIVVPSATVDRVLDALLAGGSIGRGFLGVAAQTVEAGGAGSPQDGLLVTGFAADGPAVRAGLLVGDIIVSVAGRPARDLHALHDALAGQAGKQVMLQLLRGGQRIDLTVTVGEWPTAGRRC